jgi:hypothetical protein
LPQSWSLQFADSAATIWPGNQFAKDGIYVIQEGSGAAGRRDGAIAMRFPYFLPTAIRPFLISDFGQNSMRKTFAQSFFSWTPTLRAGSVRY